MIREIIKSKFYCKSGSQILLGDKLTDRFISGNWYDGEYEVWNFESGYRLNGGWRRYWVINEVGVKEEIHRGQMKAIFDLTSEVREFKINKILDK